MGQDTLVVLGRPDEPLLQMLLEAASDLRVVVGDRMEELAPAAPDATLILSWSATRELLRDVLAVTPHLRWLHIMSAGINHLLSPELAATPALLTNGKGAFSSSLGEWVMGAILYFAKDFRRLIRVQGEGRWEPCDVTEVKGQTVGIVGYGDIGREVGTRAHAFGMHVLGLTRRGPATPPPGDPAEAIFGPAERLDMIARCDYVVVTAPLTPETRGLMGAAEFAAMRPDAVLINIGRGPVVDEQALIAALSQGRIKGAALDVFHEEPLPEGHPLFRLENVLLSPHCADHTPTWLCDAMRLFLENLRRYRAGEPLRNVVVKEQGY